MTIDRVIRGDTIRSPKGCQQAVTTPYAGVSNHLSSCVDPEGVWGWTKYHRLPNFALEGLGELRSRLEVELSSLSK
jgi:hypothetical protein